jgi:hypothetical protein
MTTALRNASMPANQDLACARCRDWATSIESVIAVLTHHSSACEGCGRGDTMKLVAEQYRKRRPRWWIVADTVVVPMWIVEYLRTRKPTM